MIMENVVSTPRVDGRRFNFHPTPLQLAEEWRHGSRSLMGVGEVLRQAEQMPPIRRGPFLTFPGAMTNGMFMWPTEAMLRRWECDVFGWGLRLNRGYTRKVGKRIEELVKRIFWKHGPIIGVGWSFGAIMLDVISKKYPEMFQELIFFCGPTRIPEHALIWHLLKVLMGGNPVEKHPDLFHAWRHEDPRVKTTSYIAGLDLIVGARNCSRSPSSLWREIELEDEHHCSLPWALRLMLSLHGVLSSA